MNQSISLPAGVHTEAQHASFGTDYFHRVGWRRVELVRDILQQVIDVGHQHSAR